MSETAPETVNGTGQGAPGPGPMPRMRKRREGPQAAPEAAAEGQRAAPPPGEAADEQPKRRRRRGASGEDVAGAARRLVGIHAVMSHMLRAPELMISEQEAVQLVATGNDLAAEFDVEVSGRFAVVLAFVGTAASVYVPRILVMSQRVQRAREEAAQKGPIIDGAVAG